MIFGKVVGGRWQPAAMELVRRKAAIRGFRLTGDPPFLRLLTARFEYAEAGRP